jgi:hypothetical protein
MAKTVKTVHLVSKAPKGNMVKSGLKEKKGKLVYKDFRVSTVKMERRVSKDLKASMAKTVKTAHLASKDLKVNAAKTVKMAHLALRVNVVKPVCKVKKVSPERQVVLQVQRGHKVCKGSKANGVKSDLAANKVKLGCKAKTVKTVHLAFKDLRGIAAKTEKMAHLAYKDLKVNAAKSGLKVSKELKVNVVQMVLQVRTTLQARASK